MSSDDTIEIKATSSENTITVAVQQLAEAFMGMDDKQQAAFFGHCYDIEEGWERQWEANGFCGGYMPGHQWLAVRDELAKRRRDETGNGWRFVVGLSAFFWNHVEQGWLGR